jgi:transcriptional regulator with XRE-family HTH domain
MQYSAWSGPDIRRMRDTLGLTQRKLAAEVGCRTSTLADWERGAALPSPIFCKLLTAFAIDVDYWKTPSTIRDQQARTAAEYRNRLRIADR